MIINHNMASLNTYGRLSANNAATSKSLEKLSSGLRINRAGDDAAGLAISEKMRAQIRGLDQAGRNSQDAISMIQTAEGSLNETHSILQRMRELAVQSATDTNTSTDRSEIQKEIDELAKEVTRIANSTEFNNQKLINGAIQTTGVKDAVFQVGANENQTISLSIKAMDAKSLGISRDKVASATGTAGDPAVITSSSFAGDLGAGIVNGAALTFNFTAGAAGNAGTAASTTGTNNFTAADLSGINADTSMTVTIDGTAYTLDNAAIKALGAAPTGAATATALNGAVNGGNSLSDVATVSFAANKLTITVNDPGATTIAVDYTGTDSAAVAGVFGITDLQAQTVAGTDPIAATADSLTITSSVGHTQTLSVDGTAKSLSVTTGAFEGMTLNVATNISTDLDGASNLTLATTSDVAAAAVFSDGALTDEATTEAGIDVSTQANAGKAISTIQNAIETVSGERSKLGAYQNRLEHTINNLGTSSENLTAAESRVRDVDMAKEMMNFQKNSILSQAATAMLAQANQQPQGVLQLLQ